MASARDMNAVTGQKMVVTVKSHVYAQHLTEHGLVIMTHHSLLMVAMFPDLRNTKSAVYEGTCRADMETAWPA